MNIAPELIEKIVREVVANSRLCRYRANRHFKPSYPFKQGRR